jgi:hypothetical protein
MENSFIFPKKRPIGEAEECRGNNEGAKAWMWHGRPARVAGMGKMPMPVRLRAHMIREVEVLSESA